jgi:hypothetical protein
MQIITAMTIGYAIGYFNSGMYSKFIPYNPTIKVSGKKKAVNTVKVRITSLVRCDESEI